jgi:hypothetical protein
MQTYPPPSFLIGTMSWIAYGYSYGSPLPAGYGATSTSTDPWEIFVYVLEEAKAGRLNKLNMLTSFLSPPLGAMLAEACFGLIGDAGSDRECEFIAETLEEGPLDLLPIAADAAHATGNLRLVQPMLRAWQHVDDRSKHLRIGLAISRLLEPPGGRIAQLAEKFTPDATERQNLIRRGGRYADLAEQHREEAPDFEVAVVTRYNELLTQFGTETSLWRGEPFSLIRMLDQMHQFAHDPKMGMRAGLFIQMRRKIEATTGWNMSNCFSKGVFNSLGTAAVLSDILENVDIDQFEEGHRYFFGHEVR